MLEMVEAIKGCSSLGSVTFAHVFSRKFFTELISGFLYIYQNTYELKMCYVTINKQLMHNRAIINI